MVASAHTAPTVAAPAAATSVRVNPSRLKWTPASKFVTDNSLLTASDFASYQIGYKPVGSTGDFVVAATIPSIGQDAVDLHTLNLPANEVIAVSMRTVSTNGQMSAWSTPVFVKNDRRIPAPPAGLQLS